MSFGGKRWDTDIADLRPRARAREFYSVPGFQLFDGASLRNGNGLPLPPKIQKRQLAVHSTCRKHSCDRQKVPGAAVRMVRN